MAETSGIRKVDLSSIAIRSSRSAITTKVLSLNVGEGFEVSDVEREQLNYPVAMARKEGITIALRKLGRLHFLVARTA